MVETVSGIEQQVQDVKKYAGQAETAASNAALSEQKAKESETAALQAKTDAETAKGSAETAAGKTASDRTAVERAKEEVLQAKQQVSTDRKAVEAVERKVAQMGNAIPQAVQAGVQAVGSAGAAEKQGIVQAGTEQKSAVESTGTKAVEDISLAKKTATDAVETAKTGAVGAIGTVGAEQTQNVTAEGEKQVKAVEDKGNEVLQSIPEDFTTQMASKLDKQQGAENKGKAMIVGEDGILIPGEMHGGEKWRFLRTVTVPADPKTDQSGVVWKLNSDGAILGFTFDTDENGEKFSLDDVRWYGTVKSNGIADGYRYFYLKDINSHSIVGYRMWYETCNAVYGALNRTGNRLYPLENCTTQFNPNAKIKSGCGNATSGFVTNYKYTCFGMACTNMFLEEGTVYHVYGKE